MPPKCRGTIRPDPDGSGRVTALFGRTETSELLGIAAQGPPTQRSSTGGPSDFVTVIAQQCRQRGDEIAIVTSNSRLTYRDLAARVAELVNKLAQSGITADSLVAIGMPRGAEEVAAMLAVLTLGAAYVPLDTAQPANRLAMIVADTQPDALITRDGHAIGPAVGAAKVVAIGGFDAAGDSAADATWEPAANPNALAYVLFTSGSTGRPKGVQITRGAISNLVASIAHTPGLRDSDVLLAVANTMFDISVLDVFGPLFVGGTLRITDTEVARDGRRLRELLEREPISIMQATPTTWHMLLESGWIGDGHLRMLVGGEPLTPDLARQLMRRGEVWNMYGPTETTVWSTCKRIESPDDITIGRPIDDTRIYVLDEHGHPVRPEMSGELCIGGAGLARGYLGQPELTAARFIPNPTDPAGERIYRTGDLVRLRLDGECEYLGRLDHQVKIRGFRIELGEIEHALNNLDGVSRAIVTKWEPPGGSATIVAYVVPSPGTDWEPRKLSELLRERLPSYMIPGRYIRMSSFPLSSNRKVDRGALPDPAGAEDSSNTDPPAGPRTNDERALHRIWSEVLGKQCIGIDDDFFDLGGQSVLAVRICDRIHRTLALDLPVSALLEQRTIRALASYTAERSRGSVSPKWSSVVPIKPNGSRPPMFCVSGIGGNPMTFVELAAALGPEQPFYGLQHRGVDGNRRPYESVHAMARQFLDDIRLWQPKGPYILAGYSGGGLAAYEMAQLLDEVGEEIRLLVLLDTLRPGLDGWSRGERARAHWSRIKTEGLRYVVSRLTDKTACMIDETAKRVRATSAALWPYRFRLDAVEMAGRRAEATYTPKAYRGDVLLFQSNPSSAPAVGIPLKQHEANGWGELVAGHIGVVPVDAGHLGILAGSAGQFVASEINRVLSSDERINDRRRW